MDVENKYAGKDLVDPPKLRGSCRFVLSIMCFFAMVHVMLFRLNFSMAMVCMTGTTSLNSTDPGYIEGEFDWDRETVSNLLASFFYGYMLTQVLGGWMSEKVGDKLSILCGVLGLSVTSLLETVAARTHWGALMAVRIIQGLLSGFTVPVIYNIFTSWSTPKDKATLMAITFSGIPLSNVINFPLAGALCQSGIDNGWPLIFYLPGITSFIWCITFYVFAHNSPEEHPRITDEEKFYLRYHSFRNASKSASKKRPKVPWLKMLSSIPVHALCIVQLASSWLFYLISINLPLFINETFSLGVVENGLLCSFPYFLMFLTSYIGRVSDIIHRKWDISQNLLRKFFTFAGTVLPAIILCMIYQIPSNVGKILGLSACAALKQLASSAGFFISHSDLAGPFSGFLFGVANTIAQLSGFLNPLLIAALAPNGTAEEWQNVFYVGAAIGGFGGIVYVLLGSNELQSWAKIKEEKDKQNTQKYISFSEKVF